MEAAFVCLFCAMCWSQHLVFVVGESIFFKRSEALSRFCARNLAERHAFSDTVAWMKSIPFSRCGEDMWKANSEERNTDTAFKSLCIGAQGFPTMLLGQKVRFANTAGGESTLTVLAERLDGFCILGSSRLAAVCTNNLEQKEERGSAYTGSGGVLSSRWCLRKKSRSKVWPNLTHRLGSLLIDSLFHQCLDWNWRHGECFAAAGSLRRNVYRPLRLCRLSAVAPYILSALAP